MKNTEKRRVYIETAFKLMQDEGLEAVSARRIAAITGTAPSAIYRHFQSLDELLVYAYIRYRFDCYQDMDRLAENASSALEMYRLTETGFAEFAFSNPAMLNGLVFGEYSDDMPAILAEYRRIFPEAAADASRYSSFALWASDFHGGNMKLLRACVEDGSLNVDESELETLNDILVHMFKGFLKTALDRPNTDSKKLTRDYIRCFERVLELYTSERSEK